MDKIFLIPLGIIVLQSWTIMNPIEESNLTSLMQGCTEMWFWCKQQCLHCCRKTEMQWKMYEWIYLLTGWTEAVVSDYLWCGCFWWGIASIYRGILKVHWGKQSVLYQMMHDKRAERTRYSIRILVSSVDRWKTSDCGKDECVIEYVQIGSWR